jgi:hypothetical protein
MGGAIPVAFAARPGLRTLNLWSIAASLAAFPSAVLIHVGGLHEGAWTWSVVAGVPTLLVGALWAIIVHKRSPRPHARLWVASPLLAALNGALVGGVFLAAEQFYPPAFLGGALLGLTFGAIFWIPALLLVLVLYGVPIAWAQALAKRGLAGEERGEQIVGATCAALGAVALGLAYSAHPQDNTMPPPAFWATAAPLGVWVFHALGAVAIATGCAAFARAAVRERRRRRFVERVEAREEVGFRVEPRAAGKVLLRVPAVASYRVTDHEELLELDEAGRATRRVSRLRT